MPKKKRNMRRQKVGSRVIPAEIKIGPVRLHQKVECLTVSGLGEGYTWKEGIVVYIHPKHRFYTVLFQTPKGSYMESYPWGCAA